ncbi:MAG: CBS domain-containing protein [Chloroflexi bacterium]|nr:CBS domain-containing protein [Chloroflexota bacterium]
MQTVSQLLQTKGRQVWSIGPEALVIDALKLMAEKEVGALLVLEAGRVAGILSERDYARKVSLRGKSSKTTPVREIMTEKVVYVRPEQTVADCMALMTNKRIRHLPVMADDQLLGVISIGDVVKAVISEQEFIIEQLENYIIGR